MRGSVKKYHLYKKLSSLLVVNFYILLGGLGARRIESSLAFFRQNNGPSGLHGPLLFAFESDCSGIDDLRVRKG
jgi:hypothetical protein